VSRTIRIPARAKLNLALAVERRRDDGYHDLRSVFVTLDLADDVRVATHNRLEVRNTADVGEDDLAARAVRALAGVVSREPHAFVRIRKRIPLAAGLGGGSADAGAVLRALAQLWKTDVDLVAVAARVGSDVPFFASGAAVALVTGRGENVRPLSAPREPIYVVVTRPTVHLSTRDVFAEFKEGDREAASHVDALLLAFEKGVATPDLIRVHASNDLLGAASRLRDAISSWQTAAASRGVALFLTGSGPTLFAIADDRADSLRIVRILKRAGIRAHAHTIGV
jgi:4-diphosphocytidyl-2-C-methyl-D-erythritol kinase